MAFRFDVGSLRSPEKLPGGAMRVDGYMTRAGVFRYRNPDGSERLEYRPPAEVFRADSLKTFADVPVTDDHPPTMIDASNARQFAVGHVHGEPRRDGEHLAARLYIMDAATVAKLEGGKVALSCGYEVDLDATPGVSPEGERYDAVQRNIRGNHVAIVDVGRAGPSARLRMDAAECATMVTDTTSPHTRDDTMNLEQALAALAAANVELGAAKARLDASDARATAAEGQVAELTKAKAKLEGDLAGANARADAADKARTDAAETFDARVAARVKLVSTAAPLLGEGAKVAGMSDREIKVAVIRRVDSLEVAPDAPDAYVDGRFESAIERADAGASAHASARGLIEAGRRDAAAGAEDSEKAARERWKAESRDAWKAKESK